MHTPNHALTTEGTNRSDTQKEGSELGSDASDSDIEETQAKVRIVLLTIARTMPTACILFYVLLSMHFI